MLKAKLFLVVILLFSSSFVYGSEIHKLRQLKEVGIKNAKFAKEKFNKLLKEQPELKRYLKPSTRDLLKSKKQEVDTIYVLGIRVEFLPDTSSLTTGNGRIDIDGNEFPYDSLGYLNGFRDSPFDSIVGDEAYHNLEYDPPHTKRYFEHLFEGLRNYWWDVSCHSLWIEFRVVPDGESTAYELPYKMTYYGDVVWWERGLLTLFKDAVTKCDEKSPEISFSKYVGDSGAIIIFHAGASWQTDYFWDSPCDIPACFISGIEGYFGTPIWVDEGAIGVSEGILYPETSFQDGMAGYLQGGLAHEFGHQLGLPDLYDISGETMGIGGWALQGTGNWNLNGLLPPYPCAWSMEKLGFTAQDVLDKDTANISISARGASASGDASHIYKVPITTGEHFLVEERFVSVGDKDTTYKFELISEDSALHTDSTSIRVWQDGVLTWFINYDWGLPPDSGMGGLAIWHIDSSKIAANEAENTINVGSPKGVDMEEADGIQDFEKKWWLISDIDAFFYGSPYDVFYKGNLAEFTPYTSPNTNNNKDLVSNISIYNISKPDTIMNFSLRFDQRLAGFPVKCGSFFDINSATSVEVDGEPIVFCALMDTNDCPPYSFVGTIIYAYKLDGTILWADTIFEANLFNSLAIGDVDEDGHLDVVATPFIAWDEVQDIKLAYGHDKSYPYKSRKASADTFTKIEGKIYIWDLYGTLQYLPIDSAAKGMIVCAPLIADIDRDGRNEIVFGSDDGLLHAYDNLGNEVSGYPKNLHQPIWATPVYDSIARTLYAVSFDGQLWAIGWDSVIKWTAIEPNAAPTTCSPVVGDLTADGTSSLGRKEIIVCTGNLKVYCIDDSGKTLWERTIDEFPYYSSPVLADIDRDSLLDIIFAAGSTIYGFNNMGANLVGFPIVTTLNDIQASPVIGDINNDGKLEIIIGSPDGGLIIYNNKGQFVSSLATGSSVYSTPVLVPDDNSLNIFVGSDDGKLYGWNTGPYGNLPWPQLRLNPENNSIWKLPIILPPAVSDVFMKKNFYIYPNPVRANGGTIRYFSGDAKGVNIKIINLASDIVKDFDAAIGINNYQDVELPDLPGGIYLCRVEVDTGNKKLVRFKKFAVVK